MRKAVSTQNGDLRQLGAACFLGGAHQGLGCTHCHRIVLADHQYRPLEGARGELQRLKAAVETTAERG
jgi:hypothetical protein